MKNRNSPVDCFVARGRAEESFSFQWANPHICAIVVTDCISFVTTFLFQKSHQLTHFVVPPLPKKLTLFGDPEFHKLHIACGDFLLSFYRKSPRAHCAAPPLPKKLTLFGDPDICFCCKDRDSNRAIRRIETVHRTVSAKSINEFGATCLLCFAQFTLI